MPRSTYNLESAWALNTENKVREKNSSEERARRLLHLQRKKERWKLKRDRVIPKFHVLFHNLSNICGDMALNRWWNTSANLVLVPIGNERRVSWIVIDFFFCNWIVILVVFQRVCTSYGPTNGSTDRPTLSCLPFYICVLGCICPSVSVGPAGPFKRWKSRL